MPGVQLGAEDDRTAYLVVGRAIAQPSHPLGRLGDEHAGVVPTRRHQQRGVVAMGDALVGRVGADELVCRVVPDRVAPFLLLGT